MKWNKQFEYPASMRSSIEGKRHYEITGKKLPSVTTILSATESEDKKSSLEQWRNLVGHDTARKITEEAAARGTAMHSILEHYVLGTNKLDMTETGTKAHEMAEEIIKRGLTNRLTEIWGSEVTLYYPGLYAGATDLVGIYDGVPSIIDFKQSNKMKRREWITDYFTQLGGYAMAHNYVYGTNITQGVNLICTKDNYYQEFIVDGQEFIDYQHEFLRRVDKYYAQLG
tara:strand:- start:165 stop:845 length:681 start_codon:yes stop_codon:yes gene_type:complete